MYVCVCLCVCVCVCVFCVLCTVCITGDWILRYEGSSQPEPQGEDSDGEIEMEK